jgi:hypothetical protein
VGGGGGPSCVLCRPGWGGACTVLPLGNLSLRAVTGDLGQKQGGCWEGYRIHRAQALGVKEQGCRTGRGANDVHKCWVLAPAVGARWGQDTLTCYRGGRRYQGWAEVSVACYRGGGGSRCWGQDCHPCPSPAVDSAQFLGPAAFRPGAHAHLPLSTRGLSGLLHVFLAGAQPPVTIM